MSISVSVVTLITYLSRLATTAPPTTTTGPVPALEPPAYLYKNTADYHWPLFSDNATKIIDGGNAEKWTKEDGIGEGPFSMGSSVKFKEGQVCQSQCGNVMIFLSFRFYVKSIMGNLEVLRMPILHFLPSKIVIIR